MKEETEFVPAGSAGGSVEMRNKRHRNNFIKADGLIEKREELIFVIIFRPLGWNHTFAEATPDEKNAISHRGQAVKALVKALS